MRKYLCTAAIILATFQILTAQSNYFEIGMGRGFISSGDGRSWGLTNEYKRSVGKGRILLGGGFSMHYSSSDNIGVNIDAAPGEYPYTIVDRNDTYPLPGFVPGEPFEHQTGRILKTKTEQHFYLNLDFFCTVKLGKRDKITNWEKNIAFGPSINYTSQNYIAETTDGVFTSGLIPPTKVILVIPYYKRLLTLGGHLKADIARRVGQHAAIGLSGRVFGNINADWVYSYTLFWRVGF